MAKVMADRRRCLPGEVPAHLWDAAYQAHFGDDMVKFCKNPPMLYPGAVLKGPSFENSQGGSGHLGYFELLSLEISHMILDNMTVQDALNFSRINRAAEQLLESHNFQVLRNHAPTAVKAISRTGVGRYFTTAHILATFCNPRCSHCDDNGPFLFLLTSTRSCFRCLRLSMETKVIPVDTARDGYGIQPRDRRDVPVMRTVPGRYRLAHIFECLTGGRFGSMRLMRHVDVLARAREPIPARVKRKPVASEARVYYFTRYFTNRWINMRGDFVDETFLGLTSVPLPYWNMPERKVEVGLQCFGCFRAHHPRDVPRGLLHVLRDSRSRRVYTEEEFEEHFDACKSAQQVQYYWQILHEIDGGFHSPTSREGMSTLRF